MFDFSKLLDIKFLTDPNPAVFVSKNLFLIVFGLIILISVLVWVAAHFLIKSSRVIRHFLETKIFYLLLVLGVGGLSLTLLRSIGASFISMRLIFLIFLLAIVAWAVYLIFYLIFTLPKEYQEEMDRNRKERYLPRKK